MTEPPPKRARHTDRSDRHEKEYTASPRSPRPHDSRREEKGRSRYEDDRRSRKDGDRKDRRRLSRSPHKDGSHRRIRSRSRERSREREREHGSRRELNGYSRRDRSRSQEAPRSDQERKHDRHDRRTRSRSPARNGDGRNFRTRSPIKAARSNHDRPRGRERDVAQTSQPEEKQRIKQEPKSESKPNTMSDAMAVDEDDEDAMLYRMMGFTSFKTTQNTKVPGNRIYGVAKQKKTEYRQYMNRVGGFNRPLSPSR